LGFAKFGFESFAECFGSRLVWQEGESARAAAGHERSHSAMSTKKFLEQLQQRVFFQRRRFQGIVKSSDISLQIISLQFSNELLGASRGPIESGREALQLLIRPRGRNSESRVNEQKPRAAQSREKIERLNLFAASSR